MSRSLRILRPLRLINAAETFIHIGRTVVRCVKPAGSAVLLAGFAMFVYSVLGVQLLSGQMGKCSNGRIFERASCANGNWLTSASNFDWIGSAALTVLTLATGDGLVGSAYDGINSSSETTGPIQDNRQSLWALYIAIIVTGKLIVM